MRKVIRTEKLETKNRENKLNQEKAKRSRQMTLREG